MTSGATRPPRLLIVANHDLESAPAVNSVYQTAILRHYIYNNERDDRGSVDAAAANRPTRIREKRPAGAGKADLPRRRNLHSLAAIPDGRPRQKYKKASVRKANKKAQCV